MPRIDDALDAQAGSSFFSSLGLRSGYWQIPVARQDKQKTAFTTPDGLYEVNVMPFGVCNSPANFKRMIHSALTGLKWKTCLYYFDDIIIFSKPLTITSPGFQKFFHVSKTPVSSSTHTQKK